MDKILKAQNGLGKLPIIGPITKSIAYKVVTEPSVWFAGGATPKSVIKALTTKNDNDDNKKYFLFGVDRPETEDKMAYNWQKDIEQNNYKNVKSYKGVLNPYNEYIINDRDKGLIEELAKKNYSAGLNINDEYTDPNTGYLSKDTPYFDDVHNYRIVFHNKDGQPVISASDLYDFGKNYSSGFAEMYEERTGSKNGKTKLEIQRKLLNSVGQPYKLVQHDIPIKFTDNPQGSEINRINSFTDQVLNRLSDRNIANILETGYIDPSIIKSK